MGFCWVSDRFQMGFRCLSENLSDGFQMGFGWVAHGLYMGSRWVLDGFQVGFHENIQKSFLAACLENGGGFWAPQGPGEGRYVEVGFCRCFAWPLARTDLLNSVMCLHIDWEEPSMDQYQCRGKLKKVLSGPLVHTNFSPGKGMDQ